MTKRNAILFLLVICLVGSALSSCQGFGLKKYTEHSFSYFDTVTTIIGYEKKQDAFDTVCNEIFLDLEYYHQLFDIYNEYEGIQNLCTVNQVKNGTHQVVTAEEPILDLLQKAKDLYTLTSGKLNVAMGSVLSIWHTYRERGIEQPDTAALPSDEELLQAAAHTNIEDVILNVDQRTVYLADPHLLLDVGAIAKGYAVEKIAQRMEEKGITGYTINVGGNVRTVGARGDGTAWQVGIENPEQAEEKPYLAMLALNGESLVTSGAYQRFYTVNGERYHHIIDPATRHPSTYFESVSVVCKDSALADALSTALFSMPIEEGLALVDRMDGVAALWLFADGSIRTSSQFDGFRSKNA